MVLKNGHARKAAELFHNENETKIQQAHNIEKENRSLIESTESLATLTKYDVHHTFESENIRQKVSFSTFRQKTNNFSTTNFKGLSSVFQRAKSWSRQYSHAVSYALRCFSSGNLSFTKFI